MNAVSFHCTKNNLKYYRSRTSLFVFNGSSNVSRATFTSKKNKLR